LAFSSPPSARGSSDASSAGGSADADPAGDAVTAGRTSSAANCIVSAGMSSQKSEAAPKTSISHCGPGADVSSSEHPRTACTHSPRCFLAAGSTSEDGCAAAAAATIRSQSRSTLDWIYATTGQCEWTRRDGAKLSTRSGTRG
jgi:hypothetical protein